MQYRRLGNSNLKVSTLCVGTMMFGKQTPFDEAARIVASARDHGINFIDTADVYNKGASEKDLGKLLTGQRQHWVLASKLGNSVSDAVNEGHYSRRWLIQQTDAILARLQTDYLDILYLHRDYHEENLEEAVRALGDLIRAGKIRSFGLSNFRGWRIAEVVHLCEKLGAPQPAVCQPYYNLRQCVGVADGEVRLVRFAYGVRSGACPVGGGDPDRGGTGLTGDRRPPDSDRQALPGGDTAAHCGETVDCACGGSVERDAHRSEGQSCHFAGSVGGSWSEREVGSLELSVADYQPGCRWQ